MRLLSSHAHAHAQLLHTYTTRFVTMDLRPKSPPTTSHGSSLAEELLAPFTHVCSLSGKGVRSKLIDAFNLWCGLPAPLLDEIKVCIDMLHNASLLIDDIEDGSEVRRGAPAAHCVYGMPLTMNCANQVYFIALQKILALPSYALSVSASTNLALKGLASSSAASYYASHLSQMSVDLAKVFTEEMICLHEGQGMDILWRDTHRCPTMEEYDMMVLKKTGGLFRMALRLMITLSLPCDSLLSPDRCTHYISLVETIGVFFQTLDDYLNVSSDQYHQSKTFCEDLTEGKFSFPVIHSITAAGASGDHRLFHILKKRPTEMAEKRHCIRLMEETGSLEATRTRVEDLQRKASVIIDAIGGCPPLEDAIQKMSKQMGVRA